MDSVIFVAITGAAAEPLAEGEANDQRGEDVGLPGSRGRLIRRGA